MTKRGRTGRPQKRWEPLVRAARIPPKPERVEAFRQEIAAHGGDPAAADAWAAAQPEIWRNGRYVVIVDRRPDHSVETLSIRRDDRAPEPFPWRDLQRIKNEVAGPEVEAAELFPAESRLMDTANQRWLWCLPRSQRFEFGFAGRVVSGDSEAARRLGARQAPLEPSEPS